MVKITKHHQFDESLHISSSALSLYTACSLRYFFHYAEKRPPERISVALLFGTAIHSAISHYGILLRKQRTPPPEKAVIERFEDCFNLDLDSTQVPVIYKRDIPDRFGAIEMGRALLRVFYENNDLRNMEIVGVEVPMEAPLYTETKERSDYTLVGVLDLIVRGESGQLMVVDFKTSSKAMAQSAADNDNQMTAYSHLLACGGFVAPKSEVLQQHLKPLSTEFTRCQSTNMTRSFLFRIWSSTVSIRCGFQAGK